MVFGFHKRLLITVIYMWLTYSVNSEYEKELLLIIKKISQERLNITCLATDALANKTLSFIGPDNDTDIGSISDGNVQRIALHDYDITKFDVPAVLDQQWETFPIQGPENLIRMTEGDFLWISARYKSDLQVCVDDCSTLKCETNKIWVHFQLHMNSTHLSIRSSQCTSDVIQLRNVAVRLNSYYKVHSYPFFQTNKQERDQETGEFPKINFTVNAITWSYVELSYVFLCSSCDIIIIYESKYIVARVEARVEEWTSVTLYRNYRNYNSNETDIDILIVLRSNNTDKPFFIARNIIIGNEESVKKHSITKTIQSGNLNKYSCEPFNSKISVQNGITGIKTNNTREINVTGISDSKICYTNGECYCTDRSQGEFCDNHCDPGFWGNCQTECDCCDKENSCDRITGECLQKEDNKCRGRTINGLRLNSTSTTIEVLLYVESDELQSKINTIEIQYKSDEYKWLSKELNLNANSKEYNYTIDGLHPNTKYSVQVFLCTPQRCFKDQSVKKHQNTTCYKPSPADLILNSLVDEISLDLTSYSSKRGSCPDLCSISFEEQRNRQKIDGLTAYTNYTISFFFEDDLIGKRVVTTTKAKPGPVCSLAFDESNNSISWKEPQNPNGNLDWYYINVTRLGSLICDKQTTIEHKTSDTNLDIDFVPFSRYTIMVKASNEEGRGVGHKLEFNTSQNDAVGSYEKQNFHINGTHYEIEINACDKVKGPSMTYDTTFTCLDSWCNNTAVVESITAKYINKSKYILPIKEKLVPFTNYNSKTSMHRNKGNSLHLNEGIFRTLPACPPPVRNSTVYSFGKDSIFVRWKQPLPPNGELELILFQLESSGGKVLKNDSKYISSLKKCYLWDDPEYWCHEIETKKEDSMSIEISAQNFNTSDCNSNAKITNVVFKESAPDPPIDLGVQWENDFAKLIFTWKHPNITNGKITKFIVTLKSNYNKSEIESTYTISNESHEYKYEIMDFEASSNYSAQVVAFNQVRGNPAVYEKPIITPPKYPIIDEKARYYINGNSCLISIPAIRETIENSSITVILSKSQCNIYNETNKNELTRKTINMAEYTNKSTISVDLPKNLNSTNQFFKDYSIQLIVVNHFHEFQRNATLCLKNTTQDNVNLASSYYVWTILMFLVIILVTTTIYIYKSWPLKWSWIQQIPCMSRATPEQNEVEMCLTTVRNTAISPSYVNQPLLLIFQATNKIDKNKLVTYLLSMADNNNMNELCQEFNRVPREKYDLYRNSTINVSQFLSWNPKILPYEHNRVKLEENIYVNASHVNGYNNIPSYIATDYPNAANKENFWLMVAQYKVKLIVMLSKTSNKEKIMYWPNNISSSASYGKVKIKCIEQTLGVNIIQRCFELHYKDAVQQVVHIQFNWPNCGLPNCTEFCELLRIFNSLLDNDSPAVVHCRSKGGATGTFILCDYMLQMVKDTGQVDFLSGLSNLRNQRMALEQYVFAHFTLYHYLNNEEAVIECNSNNFKTTILRIIESATIASKEFQYLQNVTELREIFTNIETDPIISSISNDKLVDEPNYIINTNRNKVFFASPQPTPATNEDFWLMVNVIRPQVIISLENTVTGVPFYPVYCPYGLREPKITCEGTRIDHNYFTIFNVTMKIKSAKKITRHNLKILQLKDWTEQKFVEFYKYFYANYNSSRTLVTCVNGIKRSGIFIALDYIVEKIVKENRCDVLSAVRSIRRKQKSFISDADELVYLYSAVYMIYDDLKLRMNSCYETVIN